MYFAKRICYNSGVGQFGNIRQKLGFKYKLWRKWLIIKEIFCHLGKGI